PLHVVLLRPRVEREALLRSQGRPWRGSGAGGSAVQVVIDPGAMAHGVRRWWYRITGRKAGEGDCIQCGKRLNADEAHHYLFHCERCEGIEFHRYEELEREHMGDPDKKTGIYAAAQNTPTGDSGGQQQ